jgi:hypothetical protein
VEAYKQDGFEVHMVLKEDKHLIYTRMLVTEAASAA